MSEADYSSDDDPLGLRSSELIPVTSIETFVLPSRCEAEDVVCWYSGYGAEEVTCACPSDAVVGPEWHPALDLMVNCDYAECVDGEGSTVCSCADATS